MTLLGQWFSHVGVAHTNSVAKVFQSLLLTGNSFRLLVFGTNLIAFRCQRSLVRSATAFARPPSTFWTAGSTSAFRRRYCPAGELALSPPPSPSLPPLASLLASACELSQRARLPAPSRRRRRLLATTTITATQACSPSAPCCRQASSMLQASNPPSSPPASNVS